MVTSEREARNEFSLYIRKKLVMSGPAGGPTRPETLFTFSYLRNRTYIRLTNGFLYWVAPSFLPRNRLLLMHIGDNLGTARGVKTVPLAIAPQ